MSSKVRRLKAAAAAAVARAMNDLALFLNDRDYPYPSDGLAGTLDAVPIINALLAAGDEGRGMTATEIAAALRMKRTTVLGLLNRMVESGLVIKERSVFYADMEKIGARADTRGIDRCIEIMAGELRRLRASRKKIHELSQGAEE